MYDEQSKGELIFRYKTEPVFVCPGATCDEILIIKKYDEENKKTSYLALVRNPLADEDDEAEPQRERPLISTSDECYKDCVVIKELSKEQAEKIINIIEANKALATIDPFIHLKVHDGPLEQYYFACPSFNVFTQGYDISDGAYLYFRNQQPPFEKNEKERKRFNYCFKSALRN